MYAYAGPPFNFLGHMSETQYAAFKNWVNTNEQFDSTQLHYQIRAIQLRKTAGLLENYYQNYHFEKLNPTFQKDSWQPGPNGAINYNFRNDHIPMVKMGKIKNYFKEQLNRQDEGVFSMNYIRNIIEKQEDNAQYASEAKDDITNLLSEIDTLFNQPEYEAVLVKDTSNLFKDESKFRTHQLDEPTNWEVALATYSLTQKSTK